MLLPSVYSQECDSKVQLKNKAFLGVNSNQISAEKAAMLGFENPDGTYISRIFKNTAAEKAGLKAFDYVVAIDENTLTEDQGLSEILRNYQTGDKATIHFIRDNKPQKAQVTFGTRSGTDYSGADHGESAFLGIESHANNSIEEIGMRVNVVGNSTASEMGLEDGDLITAINSHPIIDWSDVTTAINNLKAGEKIVVDYQRDGKKLHGEQNIKSYAATKPNYSRTTDFDPDSYAFLGVMTNSVSKTKAKKLNFDNHYGGYVSRVIDNTSAEKAGVQIFDYIYGIDEYRTGEHQNISSLLRKFKPGR